MKLLQKAALPHIVAILVLVLVAVIYFLPAFQGKALDQPDIANHKGGAKEIMDYRDQFGEEPLWTNSMFSGMPATQVSTTYPTHDILGAFEDVLTLWLPHPVDWVFMYMLGFYILLMALGMRVHEAVLGALAFGFSSYFFIILEAGHNSKAIAVGYMAPVLAGFLLSLRGKPILGAGIFTLFMALELKANHIQVTYYLFMMIFFIFLTELYRLWKLGKLKSVLKPLGFMAVGGILAIMANIGNLYATYEYSPHSTRGGSEVTINPDGSPKDAVNKGGLDSQYITDWSYGLGETLTLLIPNAKGGASGTVLEKREDFKKYEEDKEFSKMLSLVYGGQIPEWPQGYLNTYWGNQKFTSGPVYVGAIVCFLFFLGLVFVKDPIKWALLATTILAIALSWGKNWMGLTEFFLNVIPGYDKFRAVTIILVLAEFTLPLLAVLFLRQVFRSEPTVENDDDQKVINKLSMRDKVKAFADGTTHVFKKPVGNMKLFLISSGIFVGGLLLLIATPSTFLNFMSQAESYAMDNLVTQLTNQGIGQEQLNQVIGAKDALISHRIGVFREDAGRSLIFILLSIGLLFAGFKRMLKPLYVVSILALLILIDLWMVDKRYLNNEKAEGSSEYKSWIAKEMKKHPHPVLPADAAILRIERPELQGDVMTLDRSKQSEVFAELNFNSNYRVLNLGNPFNDARTSYFHKSIGGYHGAKMARYQDLIEFKLGSESSQVMSILNSGDPEQIKEGFQKLAILNMLNAKYLIFNPNGTGFIDPNDPQTFATKEPAGIINPARLGNAWAVSEVITAGSADEELMAMKEFDPANQAVINRSFGEISTGDGNAEITLESYLPNELTYTYNSTDDQLVVFSEIYYEKGWKAYVDGNEVPIYRANYVLRAINVPAGDHEIILRYELASYGWSSSVSMAGSIIVILIGIGVIALEIRKRYFVPKNA